MLGRFVGEGLGGLAFEWDGQTIARTTCHRDPRRVDDATCKADIAFHKGIQGALICETCQRQPVTCLKVLERCVRGDSRVTINATDVIGEAVEVLSKQHPLDFLTLPLPTRPVLLETT